MMQWIEASVFVLGTGLAALIAIMPRFGAGSRYLLLLVLPACLSAGVQAFGPDVFGMPLQIALGISFALIILAAGGGVIATDRLTRTAKKIHIIALSVMSCLMVALLFLLARPSIEGMEVPDGYVSFGFTGYLSSIFLLIISVIVLTRIEQGLRGSDETARWELKFLFLGIGAFYASIIYMSSQVLLFAPQSGLLLIGAMRLQHCLFLISCGLIALSWKRSSGRIQLAVSHGAIYSSITLLSVGAYLIASSLIARLASRWGDIGLPVEALIFLLSTVILAALLLGTSFRHRARAWIRRNIFAGRYDYRHLWLEATERVRSSDPPAITAQALADIVRKALGVIDISVWTRLWNPNRLHLLNRQGTLSESLDTDVFDVLESILNISEPLSVENLNSMPNASALKSFMEKTKASLLVPLSSSNLIAGVITVGADRSGRPHDWETREFLRILAGHAASEFHKLDLRSTLIAAKEDEAFRAFSTFVLHDLKNFASTLSLIAQNAPRHQNNPEFQKDAFLSVYDTAEKMKKLCNSLRAFSSTLAANKKLENLNQIVRSIADTLNAGIHEHLTFELAELQPVAVDAEEVGRVLQNLLLNAREAIGPNGTIIVKTADLGEKAEITVEDNGKGMSREFFEKELFVPFHTTKSNGLGIGLFQSKKIMEAHRGTISVDSEEGKGTRVALTFPVAKEEIS
jgi:putative PEP-CTERM system histidine kinase